MELKIKSVVMLCHNLRAGSENGLCNGTQMIVVHIKQCIIEGEIASGVNKGKYVLIPQTLNFHSHWKGINFLSDLTISFARDK